ncbi:MAG: bifunctional UDP-N-acetylglucosamine diphosphorylase/glucosamine-1-phosphate N-acetyltransferase GlmU [Candidatus Puniceispirillales bacterium]
MEFTAIILAAGQGKRMRSKLPKPLHQLGGKPLLGWALDAAGFAGAQQRVVITPKDAAAINDFIAAYETRHDTRIGSIVQHPPQGTGHAVAVSREALAGTEGVAIITFADTPLLRAETFRRMATTLTDNDAAVVCLGMTVDNPHGYGRLIMDKDGQLQQITEEKDASPEERRINFVNAGIMAVRLPLVFDLLDDVGTNNASGEQYLTDIVASARQRGLSVTALDADPDEVMGINDRADLAKAEAVLQQRLRIAAMEQGATLIAPETVFLHHDTVLEEDVIIEPHVVFGPGVHLGEGSAIRSFCHLEGVKTGPCCMIGPYARLRPGTILDEGVKIGNFVETKNVTMGALAKANHLSYVGDSSVGSKANIGAGTITCNYDGYNKHKTTIGDEAFIGSNTALVAPVSVGDRAIIGAGSTITTDIDDDALALTRAEPRISKGGGARLRRKLEKKRS